jgi:hypothetical protein
LPPGILGNVADAHLLAADKIRPHSPDRDAVSGQAFFVNNGEPIRYRHYPVTTWKLMGAEEKTVVIPLWVGWIMAKISELSFWFTGKRGPLTMYSYTVMTTDQYYSSEKVCKMQLFLAVIFLTLQSSGEEDIGMGATGEPGRWCETDGGCESTSVSCKWQHLDPLPCSGGMTEARSSMRRSRSRKGKGIDALFDLYDAKNSKVRRAEVTC